MEYIQLPIAGEQLPPRNRIRSLHLCGLSKLAAVVLARNPSMPSFQSTNPDAHLNRMLDYMYAEDRGAILILLTVFAFLPRFLLRWLILFIEVAARWSGFAGAPFRMLQIALKGLVFTLYYTDFTPEKSIHKALNWETTMMGEGPISPGDPVKEAFIAARRASLENRNTSVTERLRRIRRLREYILENRESIIDHIQRDTGKSRSDALVSEIFGVLDHLVYIEKYAGKILRDKKVPTPLALMGKKSRIYYEPLGVILVISPWNYPFYQAVVPITSAYVAGNSVVYKPSEHTPLTGLVERIFSSAGFAEGLVNVVYGDGTAGQQLIAQRPDKIFFTGSERTGKKVMAQAAEGLIPVELELGGKDPMIVFDDANIVRAAAGALWGGITNLGQSCTSVERIYVQKGIYEAFRSELIRQTLQIKQETDTDGDADVGAMTTDFQVHTVKDHVDDARARQALFHTGNEWDGKSRYIPPMVVDQLHPDCKLLHEETFGPLLPLIPFESEQEAIELANDSPYGLSASVWTKDSKRAVRVARAIVTGNVSINNVMLTEGNSALPFGGIKQSGFGRFKGETGLHGFCNVKSILIDANSGKMEANWFPYTAKKYELFTNMTVNLYSCGIRPFLKFIVSGLSLESYSGKAAKNGRKK